MTFLDVYGNDLSLSLDSYLFSSNNAFTTGTFLTGYSTPAPTVTASYLFRFSSGSHFLYLVVPVTTTVPASNAYSEAVVDLRTSATNPVRNAIYSFNTVGGALSAFNLLDQTHFNIFYTSSVDLSTILVSNFVFLVDAHPTTPNSATTVFGGLTTLDWNANIPTYGDKLCHAAQITTGNVPSS